MPLSRPPYPAEFRQQMVELVQAERMPAQLAREFKDSAKHLDLGDAHCGPTAASRSAAKTCCMGMRPNSWRIQIQPRPSGCGCGLNRSMQHLSSLQTGV